MAILYWKYLLMSVSGYELYLKTYRSGFEYPNVIGQLVLNDDFPRSLMHSVSRMHIHFRRLQQQQGPDGSEELERLMGRLKSHVQYSSVENIMAEGLHAYLNGVIRQLHAIADLLNVIYFAHT